MSASPPANDGDDDSARPRAYDGDDASARPRANDGGDASVRPRANDGGDASVRPRANDGGDASVRPRANDGDDDSARPAASGDGAEGARRRSERRQAAALAAVLLAVGALAWSFQLRDPLEVDPRPLDALPREFAGWRAQDVPVETTVEAILRADHNLQRVYTHPVGSRVGVYVGYYGTERGGRPEHTPWVCYPNAGWAIEDHRTWVVDAERGLRVNEFQVVKDGDRALVHFWYRSFRSTGLLDGLDQVWDRFLGRLEHDRADGALVRLSSALAGEDRTVVRSRLMGFGEQLDEQLDEHWPEEHPAPER